MSRRSCTSRRWLGLRSLLWHRTAEDVDVGIFVGVEGRKAHEEHKNEATGERERRVVATEAAAQVAAEPRLTRKSAGKSNSHVSAISIRLDVPSRDLPRKARDPEKNLRICVTKS
jgi:hypothetical protein